MNELNTSPIAVLYQAIEPPLIEGARKPKKEAGYSDSGADIACQVSKLGVPVITPVEQPDDKKDLDWVFPDTSDGIRNALNSGAKVIWANTVLFEGHPIENILFPSETKIVGQNPRRVHKYDNKWTTSQACRRLNCNVAPSILIHKDSKNRSPISKLTDTLLEKYNLHFSLIIKPTRGRGSQGVFRVDNLIELQNKAEELFNETIFVEGKTFSKYGCTLIVEQYLSGEELTITVMPKGKYLINGNMKLIDHHWALPGVERLNHKNGVAPYTNTEAAINNNRVLTYEEMDNKYYKQIKLDCENTANLVGAVAPIRVDCRANNMNRFFLFDVNMKPNMTGPCRPNREDQSSLSVIAAEAIGWSYADFLFNILNQAWPSSELKTI